MLKSKKQKIIFVFFVLFITSFFMVTADVADVDSPIYGKELNQKLIWIESEMMLFEKMDGSYGGVIVADLQTGNRPFQTYLKRKKTAYYSSTEERDVDWDYMNDKLIIWRTVSLTRPVQMAGYRHPVILLGTEFKNHLDNNFSCISDTGEARAYL